MHKVVTCPLDEQQMVPAAAARHVGNKHPHLLPQEQICLTKFLGGLK